MTTAMQSKATITVTCDCCGEQYEAEPQQGHRLLCGDSTKREDVARLMDGERADMAWFDPPFGINLVPQRGLNDAIANDGQADAQHVWRGFLPLLRDCLAPDTAAFLCQDWTEFEWTVPLVRRFLTVKSKIVWRKAQWGIGYYLRPQHEDILYCWHGQPPRPETAISDVWDAARANAPEHAAEKPIALMAQAIEFASAGGGLVIDWFAGVGGTLIAAERLDRRCYAVEISPRYCDVILRRWEAETGREATLLERISESEHATA